MHCEQRKEYYDLQIAYNNAMVEYHKGNYSMAKKSFIEIIKNDKLNIFWEGYCYLSQIYLYSSQKDSAVDILRKGLYKKAVDWNALNFYNMFLYSINNCRKFNIDSTSSYIDLYNNNAISMSDTHPQPTKKPIPVIGLDRFENKIIDIAMQQPTLNEISKIWLLLTITEHGDVGRVDIKPSKIDYKILKQIYQFIFDTKWHPAYNDNTKMNICVSIPITLK
jgi:tetratricopeptide (TPR) repeat protein